jgi:hypothetical protein
MPDQLLSGISIKGYGGVAACLFGILVGYEDCNDHGTLQEDPTVKSQITT